MLLPNKVIRYEESVISKFPAVLQNLIDNNPRNVKDLFNDCKNNFSSANIFVQTLDCLYAMNKIDFNFKTGDVSLC